MTKLKQIKLNMVQIEKQTERKPDKKERPKRTTKSDVKNFKELINKEEISINRELFQRYFSFQRPSDMLKALYITNVKKKNNDLINLIKSGLIHLKNEIKKMSKNEIKIENQIKQQILLKRFFTLIDKIKKDKD